MVNINSINKSKLNHNQIKKWREDWNYNKDSNEIVSDLGAFLKKNSYKVAHFAEPIYNSKASSNKTRVPSTDSIKSNYSISLKQNLQDLSAFNPIPHNQDDQII